ncbi:POK11 protein, partial [Passerina amoena]|nr:POK11 protein [Passerina amoena]
DMSNFAFSVPSINKAEPYKRYEWVCLPPGMKNSSVMYQIYVAWALESVQQQFPEYIIYHYMDDILVAGKQLDSVTVLKTMTVLLEERGLKIAPDKVQSSAPWKYLGWQIDQSVVKPQKLTITTEIKTVHGVQQLVRDIQWIRNICGITNEELEPLIQLLGISSWADERRTLDKKQQQALDHIATKVATSHAHRLIEDHPFTLICQWVKTRANPLVILEWVFLPVKQSRTITTRLELFAHFIMKGRGRILEIWGYEPYAIVVPLTNWYLEQGIGHSISFQIALAGYEGKVQNTYPQHRVLFLVEHQHLEDRPWRSDCPVSGQTVFTDDG